MRDAIALISVDMGEFFGDERPARRDARMARRAEDPRAKAQRVKAKKAEAKAHAQAEARAQAITMFAKYQGHLSRAERYWKIQQARTIQVLNSDEEFESLEVPRPRTTWYPSRRRLNERFA